MSDRNTEVGERKLARKEQRVLRQMHQARLVKMCLVDQAPWGCYPEDDEQPSITEDQLKAMGW